MFSKNFPAFSRTKKPGAMPGQNIQYNKLFTRVERNNTHIGRIQKSERYGVLAETTAYDKLGVADLKLARVILGEELAVR